MQKKLLTFILIVLCCNIKSKGQIILCDSIPLSYNYDSLDFTTAVPASFGDSMVTFQIRNDHTSQGFAYPLAKLVPLTPLPPGMILSQGINGWTVFASSWNPTVTMTVPIFYNVTLPIPVGYSVTFQLWVSNLLPLLIDSCYFDSTFTLNLNPSSLLVNSFQKDITCNIFPDPAMSYLNINWNAQLDLPLKISLCTVSGSSVIEEEALKGTLQKTLDVRSLFPGIYFLSLEQKGKPKVMKKIIVMNK